MDYKRNPNHTLYLQTLREMSAEKKLLKDFELSAITKELFLEGLRNRFPEIKDLYLERVANATTAITP